MKWAEFYEEYYFWSPNDQLARISQIEDLENAKSEEISDCCLYLSEESAVNELLRIALQKGIKFKAVDIEDITFTETDEDIIRQVCENAALPYSNDDIERLEGLIDDELLMMLAHKSGLPDPCFEEDDDYDDDYEEAEEDDEDMLDEDETDDFDEILDDEGVDDFEDVFDEEENPTRSSRNRGNLGLFLGMGMLVDTFFNQGRNEPFCIGDHVRVRFSGLEGTIIDKNGGLYMVAFANGKGAESYPASALQKAW